LDWDVALARARLQFEDAVRRRAGAQAASPHHQKKGEDAVAAGRVRKRRPHRQNSSSEKVKS